MQKKGNMGIGMLVILIALLIVAAVSAGMIINTTGTLKDQTHTTYQEARSKINTHMIIMKLQGTDGRNGYLNDFQATAKMAPGSQAIDFRKSVLVATGRASQAILRFREGGEITKGNTGYNTWVPEEIGELFTWNESRYTGGAISPSIDQNYLDADNDLYLDLDHDGITDTVVTCSSAGFGGPCDDIYGLGNFNIMFNLSTAGTIVVPIYQMVGATCDTSTPGDISGGGCAIQVCANMTPISDGTNIYGYFDMVTQFFNPFELDGQCNNPGDYIDVLAPTVLEEDLDDDGSDDWIYLNKTDLVIRLSSAGEQNYSLTPNTMDSPPFAININENIIFNNVTYGNLRINANVVQTDIIGAGQSIRVNPERYGEGYYSVQYLINSSTHLENFLTLGDIVNIYFEPAEDIQEHNKLLLTFIPNHGIETVMPIDISQSFETELIIVYP